MKELVKYSLTCARNETENPDLKKFLTRLIEEKPLFFGDFDGEWSERGLPEGTGYLLLGETLENEKSRSALSYSEDSSPLKDSLPQKTAHPHPQ